MSDEEFVRDAEAAILDHLRRRREAGRHDTIVAVVETPDGELYTGTPFESSQPQFGFCAERHALQAAFHDDPTRETFRRQYVAGPVPTTDEPVTTPCGACRHAMHECAPDATVFCSHVVRESDGWTAFSRVERYTVAELYPDGWEPPTWE